MCGAELSVPWERPVVWHDTGEVKSERQREKAEYEIGAGNSLQDRKQVVVEKKETLKRYFEEKFRQTESVFLIRILLFIIICTLILILILIVIVILIPILILSLSLNLILILILTLMLILILHLCLRPNLILIILVMSQIVILFLILILILVGCCSNEMKLYFWECAW